MPVGSRTNDGARNAAATPCRTKSTIVGVSLISSVTRRSTPAAAKARSTATRVPQFGGPSANVSSASAASSTSARPASRCPECTPSGITS